jgi:hypothetical protein
MELIKKTLLVTERNGTESHYFAVPFRGTPETIRSGESLTFLFHNGETSSSPITPIQGLGFRS